MADFSRQHAPSRWKWRTLGVFLVSGLVWGSVAQATTFAPPMIFFDWNSATPTSAAIEQLVRETEGTIARLTQYGGRIESITIQGHADRSGSDEYNMTLSIRRAEAVRDLLRARGLLPAPVRIEGFGERRPIRETEDGIREPRNRYATVHFMIARTS